MRIEPSPVARLVSPSEVSFGPEVQGPAEVSRGAVGATAAPRGSQPSFSEVLATALQRVNESLQAADLQARRVATGDADNLHDPLIAMAEADLALQITMRVTQKAIAAYQEISRMQF